MSSSNEINVSNTTQSGHTGSALGVPTLGSARSVPTGTEIAQSQPTPVLPIEKRNIGGYVRDVEDSDSDSLDTVDVTIAGYGNTTREKELTIRQGIKYYKVYEDECLVGILLEDETFIEISKLGDYFSSLPKADKREDLISSERHELSTSEDFITMQNQKRTGSEKFVEILRTHIQNPNKSTAEDGTGICGQGWKEIEQEINISVLKQKITGSMPEKEDSYFPMDNLSKVKEHLESTNGKLNLDGNCKKAIALLLREEPLSSSATKKDKIAWNRRESTRLGSWDRHCTVLEKAVKKHLPDLKQCKGELTDETHNWLKSLITTTNDTMTSGDKIKIEAIIKKVNQQFSSIDNYSFDNKDPSIEQLKEESESESDSEFESDSESDSDEIPVGTMFECIVDGKTKMMPKRYFWTKAYSKENKEVEVDVDTTSREAEDKKDSTTSKFHPKSSVDAFKKDMSEMVINEVTICYLMHVFKRRSFDMKSCNEFLEISYIEIFVLACKYLEKETGYVKDLIQFFFDEIGYNINECVFKIATKYPYTVQKQMLGRTNSPITLLPEQIEFIKNLENELELFSRGDSEGKRLHFCGSTFGGGKTSMASIVADLSSSKYPNITVCLVVPTKQVAHTFGKCMLRPYYSLRWNEDNFAELIASHESCAPKYTEYTLGNKQIPRTFRFGDELRNVDMNIVEKFKMLTDFNPAEFKDTDDNGTMWQNNSCLKRIVKGTLVIPRKGIDGSTLEDHPYSSDDRSGFIKKANWHDGRRQYPKPKVIISDIGSAVHLRDNLESFEKEMGMKVYFVLDENVACFDAKVSPDKNRMMKALVDFYSNPPKAMTIMSASLTSKGVKENHYFKDFTLIESPPVKGTNSFAQLMVEGKSVNPFNGLSIDGFNDSIEQWNSNCLRCFTPQMIWKIREEFKEQFSNVGIKEITSTDLSNPIQFLDFVHKLVNATKQFTDCDKGNLIRFFPDCSVEQPTKDDKKMIIATGKFDEVIMKALGETAITRDRIDYEVERTKEEMTSYIKVLKKNLANSSSKPTSTRNMSMQDKLSRTADAIDSTKQEIHDIEQQILIDDFPIMLETSLGTVTLSHGWRNLWLANKQKDEFGDKQLALATCGVKGLHFQGDDNKIVFWASRTSYPNGIHGEASTIDTVTKNVVVDISHMYGLNDHTIKYVVIDDPDKILGIDTLLQGIARACRSKDKNPIAVADIDEHTLGLFKYNGSSSLQKLDSYRQEEKFIPVKELFCVLNARKQALAEEVRLVRDVAKRAKEEQEAKIEAIAKAKAAKELAVNQAKIASARADKDAGWSTAHAKSAGAAPREQDRKTKNPPQCRFGNRCNNHKCTFSHDAVVPRPSQPCHFFFTRNGCNNGGRCTFTHSAIAPNGSVTTQLCLSYQKGTCKDSNCTRYHKDR